MKRDDFLVEIHSEELPPKALLKLAENFCQQIKSRLEKTDLSFEKAVFYAAPRRLAVLVKQLVAAQPDQTVERKGPALNTAFDAAGNPSQACIGFAKSCGVAPNDLFTIKTEQGEWVGFKQQVAGKTAVALLPTIVEQSLQSLPIPKRMRWGNGEAQFVRPVHSVVMLYGDHVIESIILGCKADRKTRGHRFMAPNWVNIPHAATYASLLKKEEYVLADFVERREKIRKLAIECVKKNIDGDAEVLMSDELLGEVTGLVEWPVALCGRFDEKFLALPQEILTSAMQDHQRYFPVVDAKGKLLPYFITMSNIESQDAKHVTHGNERVLRARLSDAAFFYQEDKKESLEKRLQRLEGIVFQAKLGTLYEKAERLSLLSALIAKEMGANAELATRAGLLAKTDLTTSMVNEFPELQGIMGFYYAQQDGEASEVALAIKEHYLPSFAGDLLPTHPVSRAVALADRIDNLVGAFGINQIPTGDKDPYGLRRAAIGVLRILIENKINLDLRDVLESAVDCYRVKFENAELIPQILSFFQERSRAFYQEQGVGADIFAAVAALQISNPLDVDERIKAVQAFKTLSEADALSAANKRVSNILSKYTDRIDAQKIDPAMFENAVEIELAKQLEMQNAIVMKLSEARQYDKVLLQLAQLRKPVDDFFDQVMVMTDDKSRRENRLLLLSQLRKMFLQVADIALLQS
ncbi:MAG: hypothetical protein ACD_46C00259G0004 [uncultured bacterium]|nr:MAG: hypothetical protein ACD_46C00259G0004 [uncultured bacterium]